VYPCEQNYPGRGARELESKNLRGRCELGFIFFVCCLGEGHSVWWVETWACVFAAALSGKGPTPYHKKIK